MAAPTQPPAPEMPPEPQLAPPEDRPPQGPPFPVVGVGASAGGLEAVTELLQNLPRDPGVAFLLVQHLEPHRKSQLAEILGNVTPMPVREVTEGMVVQPNHVYIIPPTPTWRCTTAP